MDVSFDLTLDIALVTCEFAAELCGDINDALGVGYDGYFAEYDDAFEAKRPMPLFLLTLVIGAKRAFGVLENGVQSVSALPTVKVELALLFVVIVIHGCTVGIVAVSDDRQYAVPGVFQNLNAFLMGQLFVFSCKFSEHDLSCRSFDPL